MADDKEIGEIKPLALREDAETGDRFVLYSKPDGIELELRFEGEEPWATQKQISELFGIQRPTITKHIRNVFDCDELSEESNVHKMNFAHSTKPIAIYSLDVVLAVGYRTGSREAILFRRWASQILKQYLLKGFVIDQPRLAEPDGRPDYFEQLLDTIRSIRASEKRMWTRILELASFCSDYHAMTGADQKDFFATIQNAMHWAVTQETAAEVIFHRADANLDNAGMTHFRGTMPTAKEAQIAKNYYAEAEINALNILSSMVLEFFESQAEQGRPTSLKQYLQKMRDLIDLDGRPLIQDGHLGSISMTKAKEKATRELAVYKERKRLEKERDGEIAVSKLLEEARRVTESKRAKRKATAKKRKTG